MMARHPVVCAVAVLASLGACVSLAGCGQRGPLYLPDRNAQVVTRAAVASASASSSASSSSSGSSGSSAAPTGGR